MYVQGKIMIVGDAGRDCLKGETNQLMRSQRNAITNK